MSYTCIILGESWCDSVVLNVHAATGDKIDDLKDCLYKKLENVFGNFPRFA
jgi:hypothetical protein